MAGTRSDKPQITKLAGAVAVRREKDKIAGQGKKASSSWILVCTVIDIYLIGLIVIRDLGEMLQIPLNIHPWENCQRFQFFRIPTQKADVVLRTFIRIQKRE